MTFIRGDGFTAEIIRSSKRKTVSIKISKGKVFINAPNFITHSTIEAILIKKQAWIKAKLAIQEKIATIQPKRFINDEEFLYLDQHYTLQIIVGLRSSVHIDHNALIITTKKQSVNDANTLKKLLIQWYRQQAEIILKEKTDAYAKLIGVNPTSVTIKTFKARWGSCNIKAGIQYNWKIIMAPETIIDYLVIHELCHIHHHNHSVVYWQTVAKFCEHYKEYGKWLKLNGAYLEL